MTTETKTLHTKLAQIMYEAERIPKNGTVPREMGGYRFVQVGDAADYIRKALAEHKITMLPTAVQVVGQQDRPTKSGGNMTTVDLLMEWTLTDGDSGETVKIMSFGAGADGGDKYSGKASTSAMKYALLTGFLLSTGDDTEAHGDPGAAPPEAPEPYHEDEEMIGRERRRGIIRKASKDAPDIYQLNVTPHPEGRTVGFRLETSKGNIPQCLVEGALGAALVAATGDNPLALVGMSATVSGILYHVRSNRAGSSWYRLHVDRIETTINGLEVVLPADEAIPSPPDDVPLVGESAA